MEIINDFSKTFWKPKEKPLEDWLNEVEIPNGELNNVNFIILKKVECFEKIPESGGHYWIWTNEPILHQFHKRMVPKRIYEGEIIYNGIAKDNVRQRVKHHLLAEEDAGWSGISIDIYKGEPKSHRKKALSRSGKVPYVFNKNENNLIKIRTRELLLNNLFLSTAEKDYIKNSNQEIFFFRNGICIFDEKHKNYEFRVYFITYLHWIYLEYIEKEWRKKYGQPKLCSYSSGR